MRHSWKAKSEKNPRRGTLAHRLPQEPICKRLHAGLKPLGFPARSSVMRAVEDSGHSLTSGRAAAWRDLRAVPVAVGSPSWESAVLSQSQVEFQDRGRRAWKGRSKGMLCSGGVCKQVDAACETATEGEWTKERQHFISKLKGRSKNNTCHTGL